MLMPMIAALVMIIGTETLSKKPYVTKKAQPIVFTIRNVFISFIKNEISTSKDAR